MASNQNQDQKTLSNFRSSRDSSSIFLDYKNFDESMPRLKECLSLEYDLAGRILQENKECPPRLPPRVPFTFADPDNPTVEEKLEEGDLNDLHKTMIGLTAKETLRYNSQKLQMATRLIMQCSKLLRLNVEKDSRFQNVSQDPLKLATLIEETVLFGGETLDFRDHVKQIMVLANPKNIMSEKSNLSQFAKKYSTEYEKLHVMLVKLKLDDKSNPTMTIEQYIEKLVAALFIELLPKTFDDVRKDISNVKTTSVQQPENLQEAIKLADDYDNIKSSSMLTHSDKSQPNNIVAPVTNNPKNGKKGDHPDPKAAVKREPRHTDPKKPPSPAWNNMAYCTHCQFWCRHTVENCNRKAAGKPPGPKQDIKKPAKVGSVNTYDDANTSAWGVPLK